MIEIVRHVIAVERAEGKLFDLILGFSIGIGIYDDKLIRIALMIRLVVSVLIVHVIKRISDAWIAHLKLLRGLEIYVVGAKQIA